jgi:hypothetical protein
MSGRAATDFEYFLYIVTISLEKNK